jgi:proprotein convertase subtilisin/kexin type 5
MRIFIILGLVLIFVSPACIQNCEQCSDTISCTKCNIGFFLKSSSECEPCPRNCDTCSITNGAFPTCTSCSSGAQMSSTGQCFKCIPSCSTCSLSDNNCTSCSSDLVIKVNETSGNYCYSNNYCQIYGCIDC